MGSFIAGGNKFEVWAEIPRWIARFSRYIYRDTLTASACAGTHSYTRITRTICIEGVQRGRCRRARSRSRSHSSAPIKPIWVRTRRGARSRGRRARCPNSSPYRMLMPRGSPVRKDHRRQFQARRTERYMRGVLRGRRASESLAHEPRRATRGAEPAMRDSHRIAKGRNHTANMTDPRQTNASFLILNSNFICHFRTALWRFIDFFGIYHRKRAEALLRKWTNTNTNIVRGWLDTV